MKTLRRIWQWVKKYWWLVLLGLALIVGLVLGILMGRPRQGAAIVTDFAERARDRVEEIDAEVMLEKAEAMAVTLQQKAELRVIEKQPNVRERRRALAAFLEKNL